MSARKPSTTKDPVPSSPDDAVIKLTSDGSVRSESASRDTQDLLTADTPQIATNDAHEQIVSRNEQDNDHSASNEQTPQDVPTRDMVQLTIGDDHGGAIAKVNTSPSARDAQGERQCGQHHSAEEQDSQGLPVPSHQTTTPSTVVNPNDPQYDEWNDIEALFFPIWDSLAVLLSTPPATLLQYDSNMNVVLYATRLRDLLRPIRIHLLWLGNESGDRWNNAFEALLW